ncbi:alpha/beta fold hydrolase [Metapseudomonas otitidis]
MIDFTPSAELYPFQSRFFESSAGPVHYIDEGQGRPIIMFHGNPTWSFLYRDIIRGLRGHFRCVAVDLPGFGLSDRPVGYGYTPAEHARIATELVNGLDLRDAIVMAHDWGGPVGLGMAVSVPARVTGLVLGNTWFWPLDFRARAFSVIMSSAPLQWLLRHRNVFVDVALKHAVTRTLTPAEMQHYRAVQPTAAARVGLAEFPRQLRAADPWLAELAAAVPRVLGDRPLLITFPMRDALFRYEQVVPRMRAAFRDVDVVQLYGAKHFFQEDAADRVVAAVMHRFG